MDVVAGAAEHGLPVMEIVLARSVSMLFFSAVTAAYQRHDLRGNRRLLLMARGCCGTLVRCPRHHLHLAPPRQCTLLLVLTKARMTSDLLVIMLGSQLFNVLTIGGSTALNRASRCGTWRFCCCP